MVKKFLVIILIIPLFLVNAKSGYEHDVDLCGLFYDEIYADRILAHFDILKYFAARREFTYMPEG